MNSAAEYDIFKSLSDLSKTDQELIEEAKAACKTSYSPYSGFEVGCAIRLDSGEVVKGSNQENASFPAGSCAENVTLNSCGTLYPTSNILSIAVVARKRGAEEFQQAAPCGICRQIMIEFESRQSKPVSLLMQSENGSWVKTHNCSMMLPFAFTKDNL